MIKHVVMWKFKENTEKEMDELVNNAIKENMGSADEIDDSIFD